MFASLATQGLFSLQNLLKQRPVRQGCFQLNNCIEKNRLIGLAQRLRVIKRAGFDRQCVRRCLKLRYSILEIFGLIPKIAAQSDIGRMLVHKLRVGTAHPALYFRNAIHRFFDFVRIVECAQAEITLASRTKTRTRSTNDIGLIHQ